MMIRSFVSFGALALFALSACATPAPASAGPADSASQTLGIDLGSAAVQRVHAGHDDAHATGTVDAVDAAQHKLKISHNPIPEIGWPAMTMEFAVAPSVDLQAIKPGSRVNFMLEKGQDGMYQVQAVKPAGEAK